MNEPEFILVDEVATLVSNASDALIAADVLTGPINYQYGYFWEVKTMLEQYGKTAQFAALKYPLVWLVQPFTVGRTDGGHYGSTNLRLFIIQDSVKGLTTAERMTQVIKPVLLPIYRALIAQFFNASHLFDNTMFQAMPHEMTIRPYWGEEQDKQVDDVFDCIEITNLKLTIANNPNGCANFTTL